MYTEVLMLVRVRGPIGSVPQVVACQYLHDDAFLDLGAAMAAEPHHLAMGNIAHCISSAFEPMSLASRMTSLIMMLRHNPAGPDVNATTCSTHCDTATHAIVVSTKRAFV
jgi:hypothetical protein